MKMIKSLFWRFYYGPERIEKARQICSAIDNGSDGTFASTYNIRGEKIRGFYQRSERPTQLHPLIVKYRG